MWFLMEESIKPLSFSTVSCCWAQRTAASRHARPPKRRNLNRIQLLSHFEAIRFQGLDCFVDTFATLKIPMQLEKVYEPARFEPRWAQWWVESGIYHAKYE